MLSDQTPPPPADMVMPAAYHGIVVSTFVVLGIVILVLLNEVRRHRSPIPILMMAGGMLACLTEPLWDTLGCVWYPQIGHVPMYRFFGVSMPWWVLGGYALYDGGLGYWLYRQFANGMSHTKLWTIYGVGWLANFLLEIPVLRAHVYVYYGPQPFVFLGFPLWQSMGNALMPIVAGAIVYAWRDLFTGIRSLLVVACVPSAVTMALTTIGWPTFLALHSGRGLQATVPAAIVSFFIAITMVAMIGHKLCRASAPAARSRPQNFATARAPA